MYNFSFYFITKTNFMLKKFTYLLFLVAGSVIVGHADIQTSGLAPSGNTGAEGSTCAGCHGNGSVNTQGGSITATGLPNGTYVQGQVYNFSITINQPGGAQRWGFAIKAVNGSGVAVGTFTTTNPNTIALSDELSHLGAVSAPGNSYTYNNLSWTAPSGGGSPTQVTFYYVGNAANGVGGADAGDKIYTGSTLVALPVTLSAFNASVKGTNVELNWQTASENNSSHFIVEKSADNQHFVTVATIKAAGNSNSTSNYNYVDAKPSYFERDIFYRLQMVDKDGTKKYSSVVKARLKATATFVKKIYPNPVKTGGLMQVELVSEEVQNATLELVNNNGRKMQQQATTLVKGTNMIDMTVHRFAAPGIYQVIIRTTNQTFSVPVLVQ
jgi:hypothetical protein